MLALLIAAQVAVAAAPPPAAPAAKPPEPSAAMPNLFRQPARCGAVHDEVVRQVRTAAARRGGLGLQYAVLREVDGCSVPAPAKVKQDYLAPGPWDPKPAAAPKP